MKKAHASIPLSQVLTMQASNLLQVGAELLSNTRGQHCAPILAALAQGPLEVRPSRP